MIFRSIRNRKRSDVRTTPDLNLLCLLRRERFDDHRIINLEHLRLFDLCELLHILAHDLLCGCKGSNDCGCSGTLRAYQINLCGRIACTTLEIPVGGTNCNPLRRR